MSQLCEMKPSDAGSRLAEILSDVAIPYDFTPEQGQGHEASRVINAVQTKRNDRGRGLYWVERGHIGIGSMSETGEYTQYLFLGPGRAFGEAEIALTLPGLPRQGSPYYYDAWAAHPITAAFHVFSHEINRGRKDVRTFFVPEEAVNKKLRGKQGPLLANVLRAVHMDNSREYMPSFAVIPGVAVEAELARHLFARFAWLHGRNRELGLCWPNDDGEESIFGIRYDRTTASTGDTALAQDLATLGCGALTMRKEWDSWNKRRSKGGQYPETEYLQTLHRIAKLPATDQVTGIAESDGWLRDAWRLEVSVEAINSRNVGSWLDRARQDETHCGPAIDMLRAMRARKGRGRKKNVYRFRLSPEQ